MSKPQLQQIMKTNFGDDKAQSVYTCLYANSDEKGVCFISLKRLEEETHINKSTVVDRLSYLRDMGFIDIKNQTHRAGCPEMNKYTLNALNF